MQGLLLGGPWLYLWQLLSCLLTSRWCLLASSSSSLGGKYISSASFSSHQLYSMVLSLAALLANLPQSLCSSGKWDMLRPGICLGLSSLSFPLSQVWVSLPSCKHLCSLCDLLSITLVVSRASVIQSRAVPS